MFGIRFASSKCDMLFQDWKGLKPNPVLKGNNWMKWIDLSTSVVVYHLMAVLQMKCLCAYSRLD